MRYIVLTIKDAYGYVDRVNFTDIADAALFAWPFALSDRFSVTFHFEGWELPEA